MRQAPKIDRSTLNYASNYRPSHVLINAVFDAVLTSGKRGRYKAVVFLDPKTKGLLLGDKKKRWPWSVQVWNEGGYWAAHPPNMDRSFDFLEELSWVVVSSVGWSKHMERGPDPRLLILRDGAEIREARPRTRTILSRTFGGEGGEESRRLE
jgi:hypothetical protein